MTNGKMSAQLNNQNWLASSEGVVFSNKPTTFNLESFTYTKEENYQRLSFYLLYIPFKTGKYAIKKKTTTGKETNSSIYRQYADGDLGGDGYDIDESNPNNFIEVTEIDTIQKTIKGTFETHYTIKLEKTDKNLPDKLDFLKGAFEVKMIKR